MQNYLDLMKEVLLEGVVKDDRTGVGTRSVFGRQLRFDLRKGFPLVTTKKIHIKSVLHELLWMISGDTNIKYLQDNGVSIWNEWADDKGRLGPVYGAQWRDAGGWTNNKTGTGVDQLREAIELIRTDPNSRRIIVDSWNPQELYAMHLPPCHLLFQFNVTDDYLSCHVNLRSSDVFLGLPFDIASFAFLTHMVAHVTQLQVGELVVTTGDTHLYLNHTEQALVQLRRRPRALPRCLIASGRHVLPRGFVTGGRAVSEIDDFEYDDIRILSYCPWPAIKAPVAV